MGNKLIAIVGPTASGKTELAKYLAEKFNGELISADSRQVYIGLDIGTGKDKSYPQHLLDIRKPSEQYSVAEFQGDAYRLIFDIFRRGKIPILVGGTGLYIDAVLKGYNIPKASLNLRAELEKLPDQEILQQLKALDPLAYEKIDHGNRRRLVRALEATIVNRRPFSQHQTRKPKFDYLILGITLPRTELYKRIDERVDKRIKEGMIEEVKRLLKKGVSYQRLEELGLEYRYISQYLKNPGEKNRQSTINNLKFKIHDYARRQLTWFRHNKEIHWIKTDKEAEKLVSSFLLSDGFRV